MRTKTAATSRYLRPVSILLLTLFAVCLAGVQAQTSPLSVEVSTTLGANKQEGNTIQITLYGAAPFECVLFNKAPRDKGEVLESKQNIVENTITFQHLPKKRYYLIIKDAHDNFISKDVIIQ